MFKETPLWVFKGIFEATSEDVEASLQAREVLDNPADGAPLIEAGDRIARIETQGGDVTKLLTYSEVRDAFNAVRQHPKAKEHALTALKQAAMAFGIPTANLS